MEIRDLRTRKTIMSTNVSTMFDPVGKKVIILGFCLTESDLDSMKHSNVKPDLSPFDYQCSDFGRDCGIPKVDFSWLH